MSFIDASSINQKLNAFMRSDEGKKLAQSKIREYVSNGTEKTAGGSYILNTDRMRAIAGMLRLEIKSAARRYNMTGDIPDDILELFDELYYSDPHNIGGIRGISGTDFYQIELSFETDLYRPSLEPSRWDGVDNIIKLFDDGYSTGTFMAKDGGIRHKQVQGYWPKADKVVWSVPYRKHLGFMQEAIDAFNKKYEGVAVATLLW